ncbi:Exoenzyme S synthesis regulatory protein ExsA [Thalassocella blandensis]|nr:Exoenzyme S synthesis regulatory protein ExsA [Thalassocella blandensis]
MSHTTSNISKFTVVGDDDYSPEQQDLNKLAQLLSRFAIHDGNTPLPVPDAHVAKCSDVTGESIHAVSAPGICIAAQGAKSVTLAQDSYQYGATKMAVYAAEVPIRVKYVDASPEKPYLCLVVHIDPKRMADLIFKVFPNGLTKTANTRAIYLGDSNPKIVKSAIRLLELVIHQEDADLLVPLVVDEILIRLLRSPAGPLIAQIGLTDSNAHKVSRAISWIKENYTETIKIEELAKISGMSASSFHSHFKSITEMSPLQFQKHLRLQKARNFMITQMMDVSSACHKVGYSSVSQFSREYSRLFGRSPSKDIDLYREN